jgi:RNA polymerase sigma-70 factor, ECF subfamily
MHGIVRTGHPIVSKRILLTKPSASLSTAPIDEAALVSAAQRDRAKFTLLYDRYFRPIYRYLYSRVGNALEAEDLTAQTFLAALETLPHYHHRGYFSAWLFAIARNKAIDHYRSRVAEPLDDSHPDKAEDPLGQVIQSDQVEQLAHLVGRLDEEERELLRLRFIADLSFAEIGVSLGRKEDTVKKAYYRLVARLQRQLEVSHD